VGGLICNDMWANPMCTPMDDPHLARRLGEMGARVIFHAVNGGRDGGPFSRTTVWHYHESNLVMRAMAAGAWIVTVDNCAPTHLPCSAPSGVVSPKGEWLVRAEPMGEQFFVMDIPLS
jgi:predicted amidohydrolase